MNTVLKTCVELSANYQINFQKNHSPETAELTGSVVDIFSGLEWNILFGKKFFLFPLVIILLGGYVIVVTPFYPVLKVSDFLVRRRKISEIKVNVCKLNEYLILDGKETLDSLWSWFGPDSAYPLDERVGLLGQWLKVLYSNSIADSINIQQSLDEQYQLQSDFTKKINAKCVLFGDALESVIAKISKKHAIDGSITNNS